MSKEVKIALIGAAATIVAALISGIFVLISVNASQSNTSHTDTSNSISSAPSSSNQDISTPLVTVPANTNGSTPAETLTTFCNAMDNEVYPTAYNQLTTQAQKYYGNEALFEQVWGGGQVTNCTFSNVQQTEAMATATISFNASDTPTLRTVSLFKENGVWKIDF